LLMQLLWEKSYVGFLEESILRCYIKEMMFKIDWLFSDLKNLTN